MCLALKFETTWLPFQNNAVSTELILTPGPMGISFESQVLMSVNIDLRRVIQISDIRLLGTKCKKYKINL